MSDYDELRRLLAAAPVGVVYAFEASRIAAREALRIAAVNALPGLLDIADARLEDRTKVSHAISEAQLLRRENKRLETEVKRLGEGIREDAEFSLAEEARLNTEIERLSDWESCCSGWKREKLEEIAALKAEIMRLGVYEHCHDRQTFDPACPRCGSP